MITRPSWPTTWMNIVDVISQRSYDPKLKVAAIVVSSDNTRILSLGYNGNAHGLPNERDSLEAGKSGFIHAEQNAFYKLDFHSTTEKDLYVLYSPCSDCAKATIQCGIKRVIYKFPFKRDLNGIEILRQAGIKVYSIEEANLAF